MTPRWQTLLDAARRVAAIQVFDLPETRALAAAVRAFDPLPRRTRHAKASSPKIQEAEPTTGAMQNPAS
jgi:hypothetical protein